MNSGIDIFRKTLLIFLCIWFFIAVVLNIFGIDLYFMFDMNLPVDEHLFRLETCRLATGCILLTVVTRYVFSLKALPSLSVVYYYGIYFVIGACILAFRDGIGIEKMHFLGIVILYCVLLKFEINQKKKDSIGRFRRDYF